MAAPMAKIVSAMVSAPPPLLGAGRGAGIGWLGLCAAALAGDATLEAWLPVGGGCGAAGARATAGAAAADVAMLGCVPGASVGNLMVGAAVG